MSAVGTASFADRVAKRLGIDPGRLAGAGPSGAATLADVLREAGRDAPAAARSSPAETVEEMGEGEGGIEEARQRREVVCDSRPLRITCDALAAVTGESPDVLALMVRLCGSALRDVPVLPRPAYPDGSPGANAPDPDVRLTAGPGRTVSIGREAGQGETDGAAERAVLTIRDEGETVHLGLEFDAGAVSAAVGEAFLERLRTLCLDPRRALL